MSDGVELIRVELVLGVRPMTADERKEEGDEFWAEDDEGAVSYAMDDIGDGIASLLDGESELAREVLAGSNRFVTIVSARAANVDLVGEDEVA